ncbi:hypothetical protein MAP00_003891 [Monascus purpureus]|nr:hypothetical protein MAP00_003891 [Monascus purpureus]
MHLKALTVSLLSYSLLIASLPLTPRNQTPLNSLITAVLEHVPAINGTINAVVGILTDFETLVAGITKAQTTYNEVDDSKPCTEYTLIFARGTTEPGNVGILVGPPLINALIEKVGSDALTVQGVNNYPATIGGYTAGGDPQGSEEMASEIEKVHSTCPDTHLIASGYSQGSQLVHNSIAKLPAATAEWISSVLVFGDPDDNDPIPNVDSSRVFTACHDGDNICQDGDLILPAHLTYAENVRDAAAFAVSAASS